MSDISKVRKAIRAAIKDGYIGKSEVPLDDYGKEVLREVLELLGGREDGS